MRIIIAETGTEYRPKDAPKVDRAEVAEQVVRAAIADSETELFCVLALNGKNKLIAAEIISAGIVGACLVHPREVFRVALLRAASGIVLAHNHPSGETTPSNEDIRVTRQLIDAGKVLGIPVLDHVIVGRGEGMTSIRETGMVDFTNTERGG